MDSPFYSLAAFLQKLIIKHIPNTFSHLDNSFKLTKKLKDIFISDNHVLISLDIISPFTYIPLDLAIESVSIESEKMRAYCH